MPLDSLIPPLAAAKTVRTIWAVKIERATVLRYTNRREGVTVGADTYVYRTGLEVGALAIAPEQSQISCEVSFSDADATAIDLVLDASSLKVPVTILRLWWNGSTWISETYLVGKLGRPYTDAFTTRIEVVSRHGRKGKATKTPWNSVLTDHEVLGPNAKIEVG